MPIITEEIIGSASALSLGAVISLYLSNAITGPLNKVVNRAKEITDGNLTTQDYTASGKNELTELSVTINNMNNNVRGVISSIDSFSDGMVAAANQVQGLSSQLQTLIAKFRV